MLRLRASRKHLTVREILAVLSNVTALKADLPDFIPCGEFRHGHYCGMKSQIATYSSSSNNKHRDLEFLIFGHGVGVYLPLGAVGAVC